MSRTPEEIMDDFDGAIHGTNKEIVYDLLWEIIGDIVSSVSLAEIEFRKAQHDNPNATWNIFTNVKDYVGNHYGN